MERVVGVVVGRSESRGNGQPSHPSPPEAAWINPPSNMTLH